MSIISFARCRPTTFGSIHVLASSGTSPIAAKRIEKRACVDASSRSNSSGPVIDMPTATPLMAPMTGFDWLKNSWSNPLLRRAAAGRAR